MREYPFRGCGIPILIGLLMAGCSDLRTDPTATLDPLGAPAMGSERAGQADIDGITEIARALALSLAHDELRRQLFTDLRDSPFPQHRLHLTSYLRGDRGGAVAEHMAGVLDRSPGSIRQALDSLPELEASVPRVYDRVTWRGEPDVIVVGLVDGVAGALGSTQGYDVEGAKQEVELWRGAPRGPLLAIYPVLHDFGSDPEEERRLAPRQERLTISTRQQELPSRAFDIGPVAPVGPEGFEGKASAMGLEDCDPEVSLEPCPDPDPPGGYNWGGRIPIPMT